MRIIRSARKTISIEIRPDGEVWVRAPRRASRASIDLFLETHQDWVRRHQAKALARARLEGDITPLTEEELAELAAQAKKVLPERVRHYAPLIGVTCGRITIRSQRTRWGSCSSKGNLNFNCLLMLAPPEVQDSVVVHELCHRKEMNHSERFYAEVLRVFPEYHRWHGWLKENGRALLRRLPE